MRLLTSGFKGTKSSVRLNGVNSLYTYMEAVRNLLAWEMLSYDVKMLAQTAFRGPPNLQIFASYAELCQELACINLASGGNLTF